MSNHNVGAVWPTDITPGVRVSGPQRSQKFLLRQGSKLPKRAQKTSGRILPHNSGRMDRPKKSKVTARNNGASWVHVRRTIHLVGFHGPLVTVAVLWPYKEGEPPAQTVSYPRDIQVDPCTRAQSHINCPFFSTCSLFHSKPFVCSPPSWPSLLARFSNTVNTITLVEESRLLLMARVLR